MDASEQSSREMLDEHWRDQEASISWRNLPTRLTPLDLERDSLFDADAVGPDPTNLPSPGRQGSVEQPDRSRSWPSPLRPDSQPR
jgi:hypothetical protein